MKRAVYLTIVTAMILISPAIEGQPLSILWANQLGGSNQDHGKCIAIDLHNNVISGGSFYFTVDFDPGDEVAEYNGNGKSGFLRKLDPHGNYLWTVALIGESAVDAIVADEQNNIIAGGTFRTTIDFDPGPDSLKLTPTSLNDAFIAKYTPDGELIWAINVGSDRNDGITSLCMHQDNSVLAAGYFENTIDFDPGEGTDTVSALGAIDCFIMKLDEDGVPVWRKPIQGWGVEYINGITADQAGNIYATGQFSDSLDVDPGAAEFMLYSPGISTPWQMFILKLDNTGNFLWGKEYGGLSHDIGSDVELDPQGNLLIAGSYVLTADFNPEAEGGELVSEGYYNVFVLKLNASGDFIWVKAINGTGSAGELTLATDNAGAAYITGFFTGSFDADPGPGSVILAAGENNYNILILKLDAEGNHKWAYEFGSFEMDSGNDISTDDEGHVYTTGSFSHHTPFDLPGNSEIFVSYGLSDAYIMKLHQENSSGIDKQSPSDLPRVFPNPFNDLITVETDLATGPVHAEISDIAGRTIYSGNYPSTNFIINDFDANPGVYFLDIIEGTEKRTVKLLKQ